MIDVHCHLNFHKFEQDYDEVIKRALEKGVTIIINTGTSIESSKHAVQLADQYENLYAIVGIHPHHADKVTEAQRSHPESAESETKDPQHQQVITKNSSIFFASAQNDKSETWIQQLEKLTKHPKVIGIGEIGLDYFSYQSNGIVEPKIQKKIFEEQLMLAHRAKLPLQIHNRQAGEDVIQILRHHKNYLQPVPGMFHCFAGSMEVLKDALDLGFYIGFDGNITYKGLAPGETVALPDIAKYVPLDRIVCETDSPYLTPIPYRGQRNEPQYVILVAQAISEIKGVSYTKVVEQTTQNVYTMFSRIKGN